MRYKHSYVHFAGKLHLSECAEISYHYELHRMNKCLVRKMIKSTEDLLVLFESRNCCLLLLLLLRRLDWWFS